PLNARGLNGVGQLFSDFLVYVDDDCAFVILDLLKRYATDDAVTQRLDDLTGFDHGADVDAVDGAAVVLGDDDVLGHVNQTTGEVTGVSSLERGIRQSLTSAVSRDEVLQHGESFTEVGGDRRLDDLARGLGHQSAHTGELADLLF